ncbi:MAG: hypothetical protein LBF67_03040 [Prevotellaceae bacterium]|nr:hypothetical protein [Prevotellaceae bacterium]
MCFIEPLFHEVIRGQKPQTRRVVNMDSFCDDCKAPMPRYRPGEVAYLKEPYAETCDEYGTPCVAYRYTGEAFAMAEDGVLLDEKVAAWDIGSFPALGSWKNKLFMPKKYARYFIEFTSVRRERLQDISDEDCLKEGIKEYKWEGCMGEYFYVIPDMTCPLFDSKREAYAYLIDSIVGDGTWEGNPDVWVYDFKLVNSKAGSHYGLCE